MHTQKTSFQIHCFLLDISPALRRGVQFDAQEFYLALVSSLLAKADAQ